MFRLAADVQVYLHRETIDFRIGINGLAILVEQAMHLDPFGRAVFGFCNMIGLVGGLASQVSLGIFVDFMEARGYSGRASWDPAFYVFGGLLVFAASCWLFIDAERPVVADDAIAT